jgi:hypothetical protein
MTLIYEQKSENLIWQQAVAKLTATHTTSDIALFNIYLGIRHTVCGEFKYQLPLPGRIAK